MQTRRGLISLVLISVGACTQPSAKESAGPVAGAKTSTSTGAGRSTSADAGKTLGLVTYEGWLKGWLSKECTSCHNGGSNDSGLREDERQLSDLTSYAMVKAAADDVVARIKDKKKPMPPGQNPPEADIKNVEAWVAAGMPEKDGGGSGDAARGAGVTYKGWVASWLKKECTSCHGPKSQYSDLSTYSRAKADADQILERIKDKDSPMPPKGLPSKADVRKFEDWVAAGMPEDEGSDDD